MMAEIMRPHFYKDFAVFGFSALLFSHLFVVLKPWISNKMFIIIWGELSELRGQ